MYDAIKDLKNLFFKEKKKKFLDNAKQRELPDFFIPDNNFFVLKLKLSPTLPKPLNIPNSGLENSIFIKHKTICIIAATFCAFTGITLSGLSLGLGLNYRE